MRKLLGLSLALVVALAACSQDVGGPISPAPGPDLSDPGLNLSADGDYVLGHLLVKFRTNAPKNSLLNSHRSRVLREILLGIEELEVPVGSERLIAEALQRSGWVEFAEPDYVRTTGIPCSTGDCTAPTDTYLGYRWDLHNDGTIKNSSNQVLAITGKVDADIDWLEAFSQLGNFTGSARIAILDTGVDKTHPDLSGRVVAEEEFLGGRRPSPDDSDGHGTHVAGIAAAAGNNNLGVAGIAWGPNIGIMNGKVCAKNGCPVSAIADGIRWAVDNGANVINLSLGGSSGSSTEQSALQYARSHNVLPFCAAGNDGGPVNYPAAFPECVAVSATDWGDHLASYSSFGSQVELAAPGGDTEDSNGYSFILSTYWASHGCHGCYAWLAGTSMATPEAAGLATLLHALGITDANAKLQRMKDTADDLGSPGTDNQFGAGRINVYAAVNGSGPPPPPLPQCSNGLDDDNDGKTDYPADPGCSSLADDSESPDPPPAPQCNNGIDDDNDGKIDYPADPGCSSLSDDSESPDPPTGTITLSATGRARGDRRKVDLTWSGANGASVEIWRGGSLLKSTTNDGSESDQPANGFTGTLTYKICQTGGSPCSNNASVTF